MICLPQVTALFRPQLYIEAQRYAEQFGPVTTFGMECVSPEQGYAEDGVLIWAEFADGSARKGIVYQRQIERALDAGLRWSHRLVGGPSVWRARPLWKTRDEGAYIRLMKAAIATIFQPPNLPEGYGAVAIA